MQEWDNVKIKSSKQEKLVQPLKLTNAMRAPKFTACIREMLLLLESHNLPAFATKVQMGPILDAGNAPLADFLDKTSPVFNEVLARYLVPGAPPTRLISANCMVGGGIDVPGVREVIQGAIDASLPAGLRARGSDVAQVVRGCIIYRMLKMREGLQESQELHWGGAPPTTACSWRQDPRWTEGIMQPQGVSQACLFLLIF